MSVQNMGCNQGLPNCSVELDNETLSNIYINIFNCKFIECLLKKNGNIPNQG